MPAKSRRNSNEMRDFVRYGYGDVFSAGADDKEVRSLSG